MFYGSHSFSRKTTRSRLFYLLTLLVPIIIPLPVMILGLFASSIQALVFSTLSAAYIGEAIEEHGGVF